MTFLGELKEKQKEQQLYHRYKLYYREGNTVTDTDNGTEPVGFVTCKETGYQDELVKAPSSECRPDALQTTQTGG